MVYDKLKIRYAETFITTYHRHVLLNSFMITIITMMPSEVQERVQRQENI